MTTTTKPSAGNAGVKQKRAHRDSTARVIRLRLDHASAQRLIALQNYLDQHLDRPPSMSVALRWAVRFACDAALGDPMKPGSKPLLERLIEAAASGE